MKPREEEIRLLVGAWIRKAELDLKTVVRLSAEGEFRDVVGFHAQQAVEKYLKALLTRYQIEFPKTHVIRRLLILLEPVESSIAQSLDDANWLSPLGAEIRYPGDRAELLPGEEVRARQLAQRVREAVMDVLGPYLSTIMIEARKKS